MYQDSSVFPRGGMRVQEIRTRQMFGPRRLPISHEASGQSNFLLSSVDTGLVSGFSRRLPSAGFGMTTFTCRDAGILNLWCFRPASPDPVAGP